MPAISGNMGKAADNPVMTVDRGNTLIKIGVYHDDKCLFHHASEKMDIEYVATVIDRYSIGSAIYSAVGHTDVRFVESLRMLLDGRLLVMTHATPLPIDVVYRSRSSLGLDRVAAVIGAMRILGHTPFVVADAGTCLTLDRFDGNSFVGGNISAGITMRLKAVSEMTARLPLVEKAGELPEFGVDTVTALRCGAIRGVVAETADFYADMKAEFNDARLVLCGGDADIIAPILKEKNIESVQIPDAVDIGLAAILNYNEKN